MKQTDIKIISHLRKDGRKSITEISKETKIPTSTIFNKLKELERYVIKKYTALIDYETVGHYNWNKIIIKIEDNERKRFEQAMKENPNINTLFETNGEYNYMIETVFPNIKEFADFMRDLHKNFTITHKKELQIIKEIKQEEFTLTQ